MYMYSTCTQYIMVHVRVPSAMLKFNNNYYSFFFYRLKLNGTCDPITTGDVVVYVNDDKTGAKTATNVLLNG